MNMPMEVDIHSKLAPAFPMGGSQNQIIAELGDPQDRGNGSAGFTLLAYYDKTIQFSFRGDRLFLVAFYFRLAHEKAKWPQCFEALNVFSSETEPSDVEAWLAQNGSQCRRTSVGGNDVISAPTGVQFCFESGLLNSIQIIT